MGHIIVGSTTANFFPTQPVCLCHSPGQTHAFGELLNFLTEEIPPHENYYLKKLHF